jgi:hypothetical protein
MSQIYSPVSIVSSDLYSPCFCQKPQPTLIAWRCCNGRPKSETANPNRGTTPPHSCYASRNSIFLYSVTYGRGTLGGMPHA